MSATDFELGDGVTATIDDAPRLAAALEQAANYRGDMTLVRRDGTEVRGFVFDGMAVGDDMRLRLLPPDSPDRIEVMASDVVALTCDKDPAAGRTWENWVRRYAEKKLAGESASIESESLED